MGRKYTALIPLELIVLFAFAIFIIWIGRMIYRRYTQTRARTVLTLEIGNYNDTVTLPVMNLLYSPSSYCFLIRADRTYIRLIETNLVTSLLWADGNELLNIIVDTSVTLLYKLNVPWTQVRLLKRIMARAQYVVLHTLKGKTLDMIEVVTLKPFMQVPADNE